MGLEGDLSVKDVLAVHKQVIEMSFCSKKLLVGMDKLRNLIFLWIFPPISIVVLIDRIYLKSGTLATSFLSVFTKVSKLFFVFVGLCTVFGIMYGQIELRIFCLLR